MNLDERDIVVERGVEPGVMGADNVTVHLNKDPNDPRIVRKPRLISGIANSQLQTNEGILVKNKEKIMSFSKTVTTKDGREKNVIADSEEELKAAVKAAESEEAPTYPNIDKPVAKGHDLVEVQDDLSVTLVDGTGEHNSPRDAVRDDGSAEARTRVPGLPDSLADDVPDQVTVGEEHTADLREQIGNEKVEKAEEAEAKKDAKK